MAAKNTSVVLGEKLEKFASEQVASGAYGSVSEVIRAGVRMLAEREAKIEALRIEIQKGIDSGPARPFDWDAFMEEQFGNPSEA